VGVVLTSWDYMWRSTPLHRTERAETRGHPALSLPDGVSREDVQGPEHGYGPLFHRRYRTRIADPNIRARELMAKVQSNPNRPAPSFVRFQKVLGERGRLAVGDELVVRMPGPWDGPVRVAEVTPDSFRLATLDGHLEAGQIWFRAGEAEEGELAFEIESWARSSTRVTHVLYQTLRMSKEVQAHMWISFLEGVTGLANGRMRGGVTIETERFEWGFDER
jgi:hypothetical protein